MEAVEYKKLEDFEKHYWWHKGKLSLITSLYSKYLKGKKDLNILEIGCGTGEVLTLLKNWGKITGMDFSQEAIEACKKKGFNNLYCEDINILDLSKDYGEFDLILALDVLEHIRDDVKTMKKVRKLLKPGGLFFVAVPAYKFLWSTHDEALHHLRRYHSLEINQKLKDSGFEILKSTHFVAALFFPIASVRLLNNFIRRRAYPKTHYLPLPQKINNILTKILEIESKIIKNIYLPIGTTLVVVARKNEK